MAGFAAVFVAAGLAAGFLASGWAGFFAGAFFGAPGSAACPPDASGFAGAFFLELFFELAAGPAPASP